MVLILMLCIVYVTGNYGKFVEVKYVFNRLENFVWVNVIL